MSYFGNRVLCIYENVKIYNLYLNQSICSNFKLVYMFLSTILYVLGIVVFNGNCKVSELVSLLFSKREVLNYQEDQ